MSKKKKQIKKKDKKSKKKKKGKDKSSKELDEMIKKLSLAALSQPEKLRDYNDSQREDD